MAGKLAAPIAAIRKPQSVYGIYNIAVTSFRHIGGIIYADLKSIPIAPLCRRHYGGLRHSSRKGKTNVQVWHVILFCWHGLPLCWLWHDVWHSSQIRNYPPYHYHAARCWHDPVLGGRYALVNRIEGKQIMAFAFYALLIAGLAIGIYGVIDAIRNLKGNYDG